MMLEDIAIGFVPQLGVRGVVHLRECFGSMAEVYAAGADVLMARAGLREPVARSIAQGVGMREAQREVMHCERHGVRPVAFGEAAYPRLLAEAVDAPHVLYVSGATEALASQHMLSVVGTRRMTPYGELSCTRIVEGLAEMFDDLVVVSGLAFGIDAAAHRAALRSGVRTVGVIASALPGITPTQHAGLARDMVERGGAVVTELHSQTRQNGSLYIPRNRIIAALGEGLLLVESPTSGGSMATARMAQGYDRAVMAVPGRMTDATSAGCNHLIKSCIAGLVTSAEDVAEALGWRSEADASRTTHVEVRGMSDDEQRLLAALSSAQDGMGIEQLVELCDMPAGRVTSALMCLELTGVVRQLPGKIFEKIV